MEIRTYRETDSEELAEFIKQSFLSDTNVIVRSHEPEYYSWKFRENHCGKPVVWIAKEKDEMIGILGVIPKRLSLKGKEFLVGEIVDAFVNPQYHGYGVFQKLVANVFAQCKKNGIDYLYATPNEVTRQIWTKLYRFQLIFDYCSLVRPLVFDSILLKKIRIKSFAILLGKPISMFYRLIFNKQFTNECISLEKIEQPDERINRLWQTNQNNNTFGLVKNSVYLKWRFVENPEEHDIYLLENKEELLGYVVIKINEIKGFKFAHIVDSFIHLDDKTVLDKTITCLLEELSKERIDFVSSWAIKGSNFYRTLKMFGFLERKKNYCFVMRSIKKDLSIPEDIVNINLWNFAQGDSDLI